MMDTPIGYISKNGVRTLRAGGMPTISRINASNSDTPIYIRSEIDLKNSEFDLQNAYERGREDMRLELLSLIEDL